METYTAMRHFADSWGLLAMTLFFLAVVLFTLRPGARKALLGFGATAFVAAEASDKLAADGIETDAWVVNGLPLDNGRLAALFKQYPEGIVTIEDGLIGSPEKGLRGFAGLVCGAASGKNRRSSEPPST